jgi:hypothetical protein
LEGRAPKPAICIRAGLAYLRLRNLGLQSRQRSWVGNQAIHRPAFYKIAMDEGRILAEPYPGVMVFIDLTGQNLANQYISHVGIVESVNGAEFVSIEPSGLFGASVVVVVLEGGATVATAFLKADKPTTITKNADYTLTATDSIILATRNSSTTK